MGRRRFFLTRAVRILTNGPALGSQMMRGSLMFRRARIGAYNSNVVNNYFASRARTEA